MSFSIRLGIMVLLQLVTVNCMFASGFIDHNYYYDSRDYNVLTLNIGGKISEKAQYFSLTNYFNTAEADKNFETTNFYTEQNLRWLIMSGAWPTDLTAQWVMQSNSGNDLLRLGARLRVSSVEKFSSFFNKFKTRYSVNFHVIQFDQLDGSNWQIEHVYKVSPDFWNKRLYLSGFLDHNLNDGSSTVVTEHQFGINIVNHFYGVIEYKHNGFLDSDKTGVAYGVQYKIIY